MAYISFQPKDYYNTTLYTGNGSTGHAITGVGFQADLTWIKNRETTDVFNSSSSVSGVNKYLITSTSDALQSGTENLQSFDADGFTVGTDNQFNVSADGYASWNWKAGTTSGIVAGSQTITPSAYSINTTAGFGIYKWSRTGASTTDYFSHGLGATPTIAIQKRTDGVQDWYVNFTFLDGTMDYLNLNDTDAKYDGTTTLPTSTNWYPKSPETGDYITYLFTPKTGYSSFGSYTGNGNADGPFIYTGFRPACIIIKISSGSGTGNWYIFDNKRLGYNVDNNFLYPNLSSAEATTDVIDLTSNGFKIRSTEFGINADGKSLIYMAFAEFPLVSSNDVPGVAR